jgi:hypothetical protein
MARPFSLRAQTLNLAEPGSNPAACLNHPPVL